MLKEIAALRKQRDALDNSLPATMVMAELEKPREAFILKRGQYDQRGDPVTRGLPSVLPPLPAGPAVPIMNASMSPLSVPHSVRHPVR